MQALLSIELRLGMSRTRSKVSLKLTSSNSLLAPELKLGDRARRRTSSSWPHFQLMQRLGVSKMTDLKLLCKGFRQPT